VSTRHDVLRAAEKQLVSDLEVQVVNPVGALLGLDLADLLRQRVDDRTQMIICHLTAEDDDKTAADVGADLMATLWGHNDPPHEWWCTPLGRLCARALDHDDSESVTQHVAAAMLGITRGSIAQMLHRGNLDRHPDGGVLRSSVIQRINKKYG
jgi:hypothetical protein